MNAPRSGRGQTYFVLTVLHDNKLRYMPVGIMNLPNTPLTVIIPTACRQVPACHQCSLHAKNRNTECWNDPRWRTRAYLFRHDWFTLITNSIWSIPWCLCGPQHPGGAERLSTYPDLQPCHTSSIRAKYETWGHRKLVSDLRLKCHLIG